MISNEKMEKLWWQYKNEGVAKNLSLQAFCSLHSVLYNAFEKYLKVRRHFSDVHHITVTDLPKQDSTPGKPQTETPAIQTASKGKPGVRIKILIHMSNGVQVSKKNMDYRELHELVEKLEALC